VLAVIVVGLIGFGVYRRATRSPGHPTTIRLGAFVELRFLLRQTARHPRRPPI
jgi:hypothetical protein